MVRHLVLTKNLIVLLVCSLICACTGHHFKQGVAGFAQSTGISDGVAVKREQNWTIATQSHIYLAYPVSFIPGDSDFTRLRSRIHTFSVFAVRQKFSGLTYADHARDLQTSLNYASVSGADFMFLPVLVNRENKINSLHEAAYKQGLPYEDPLTHELKTERLGADKLDLILKIYDVRSRRQLDTIEVKARSAWMYRSFVQSDDLAQKILSEAVSSISL